MPPVSFELWYLIAAMLIAIGMAGIVLPALPGVPLVFGGMLLAAWAGDFEKIGVWTLVILGVLTLLAMVIDLLASMFGTKIAGASKWAFIGAGIGALVGLFAGIVGLLIGPFVGAVAGEMIATNNLKRSTTAGLGATLGLLLGAVAKIALAFTMLGVFAFSWFVG